MAASIPFVEFLFPAFERLGKHQHLETPHRSLSFVGDRMRKAAPE
jgi:hypothetical protein